MSDKVLILGAGGMLGHMVYDVLKAAGREVYGTVHRSDSSAEKMVCDARNTREVEAILEKIQPDYVINCIGILNTKADDNKADTIFLNAYFPQWLNEQMRKRGGRLIHISTDCVFDGSKGNYDEKEITNAKDLYGRSKAMGEVDSEVALTLRTSIIGPELKTNGTGLFHWFMNQKSEVSGYTQAFWSGVTTLELSRIILHILPAGLSGVLHVTNGERISKYKLLELIKEHFKKEITLHPSDSYKMDKTLRSSSVYDFEVASYDQMIRELRAYMSLSDKYRHYL